MSNQYDLNKMAYPADKAKLGDKLAALIALANELKTDYTALKDDVAAIRTAYEAHRVNATAHASADSTNTVAALTSTAIAAAAVDTL